MKYIFPFFPGIPFSPITFFLAARVKNYPLSTLIYPGKNKLFRGLMARMLPAAIAGLTLLDLFRFSSLRNGWLGLVLSSVFFNLFNAISLPLEYNYVKSLLKID